MSTQNIIPVSINALATAPDIIMNCPRKYEGDKHSTVNLVNCTRKFLQRFNTNFIIIIIIIIIVIIIISFILCKEIGFTSILIIQNNIEMIHVIRNQFKCVAQIHNNKRCDNMVCYKSPLYNFRTSAQCRFKSCIWHTIGLLCCYVDILGVHILIVKWAKHL